jgi:hypothetical protein
MLLSSDLNFCNRVELYIMAAKVDKEAFFCIKHPMKPANFWSGTGWTKKELAKIYALEMEAMKDALLCGGIVLRYAAN